jgi:hypothetical protein
MNEPGPNRGGETLELLHYLERKNAQDVLPFQVVLSFRASDRLANLAYAQKLRHTGRHAVAAAVALSAALRSCAANLAPLAGRTG